MSDLISRSELIKCFKEHMLTAKDFREIIVNIIPTIKNQPTAYDVVKVVAKMEKAKHEICLSDDDLEYYQNGIDRAIEIVKQGCVYDDVCEWKQTSTAKYKTECGYKLEEYFDTKACYCKQCGKKIRMV